MKALKLFSALDLLAATATAETHRYESDISKLRNIVIHSIYSHKDVFLRELLSNSADALQKLRITNLREGHGLEGWQGNITIEARKNEGGKGGQLVIRDTGIGMTKDELATNLGTIAKSGTSEFLHRAVGDSANGGGSGNEGSDLIGQFGLGFYSSYLVSPRVKVISLPAPSPSNPEPEQWIFESTASGDEFSVYPDPRGKTLKFEGGGPCGTEIVLDLSEDGENDWVLETDRLKGLVEKHSQFASSFPIYLRVPTTPEPVNADDELEVDDDSSSAPGSFTWQRLNEKGPIWMQEPKKVSEEEYRDFYKTLTSSEDAETLGWAHWKGDTGSGVSFRAMMYVPSAVPDDFWQKITAGVKNIRLMVKRVFITDDLGADYLPQWLRFLNIVVDADDLPLNVSRETLQANKFIKQLRNIIIRKALDLFTRLANDDEENFKKFSTVYGSALRVGILESSSKKDQNKLASLLRVSSTRSDFTSFDEYVENRRGDQKQIFYLAGAGESPEALARSPLVEKPVARGYEVLLLNAPPDESVMLALRNYRGLTFQDVSKKGLKYGDEDEHEAEKAELAAQNKAFAPLLKWLKSQFEGIVADVVLTNRLVSSPCAIVADNFGWSANAQRLAMANAKKDDPMLVMMAQMPKILELNPKSPLVEGLLERLLEMPSFDEDINEEGTGPTADELELRESAAILIDTALIRSGFNVKDSNTYFDRVESLLRRSLGVSLSARTKSNVRPAPPVATGPLPEVDEEPSTEGSTFEPAAMLKDAQFEDWASIKQRMKESGEQLEETILQRGEEMAQAVKDGAQDVAEGLGLGPDDDDGQAAHDEL
ncbi:putative cation-transporting ATPase [Filobasidium floriforme]|uniref:putative cation-transporting ATPase n=1 Tax=Filobasidium floriforme TaxID=5210 RepID=UPI001E8CC174|nr:putative cation-transporting ATPase [Filobasidium floriforme]KAH8090583.1 putative cation-transporting ATPase [Filobasidium floriforme]